jgi:hypothetical protein
LPGSTLAPRGATGGYVIADVITLASFIVVWFSHPILLYIGRDANLSLWLSKTYADWAYPFDVTAMNPFHGMTSMLMPINPYFNPATWIFQTALPEVPSRVISFIVYFLEVTASAFLLGVALGFSRLFAFVGALWLAFLLFPPFNFVYGLQCWLATNPPYGHTLALSNLILVAFIQIGGESPTASGLGRRLARNWLLASCIFVLVLLIILAAPFYNGGMLVGTFLLTGVIFLSSESARQMLWRVAAGIYVLACCAAVGFSDFFVGAQAYSARFSGGERPLLQFHWPVEFSPGLIANARQGLCVWGVVCDRLDQWPLALTGSYWLQLSVIVGAIAVAIRMRPPLRARRSSVCGALGRSAGGLDRREPRNHGLVSTVADLFLSDDVSVLGILQPVCGRLAHRDNDVALCPDGAICRFPFGLRRALRGGCRAHPTFPRRCLPRVQVGRRSNPRRDADYASSAARHRAASRPDLPRIGRHSPRFSWESVAATAARKCRAAARAQGL